MKLLLYLLFIYCASCHSIEKPATADFSGREIAEALIADADTVVQPVKQSYSNLVFIKKEIISSAPGTKSVLFNSTGTRLYAMNLEGMSVYEFDQPSRKILREFKFKPTKGTGWDYALQKPISSFQEKPVKACMTNNDKFLWVSLHNAGGIVPLRFIVFNLIQKQCREIKKRLR